MRNRYASFSDVTILGKRSRFRGVRLSGVQPRPRLRGFIVNDTLARHRIPHVGVQKGFPPLCVARTRQTTTYFFACFGGAGDVFVDGRWRVCRAGMACLLPPHTFEAFHAIGREPWEFCWVCCGPERVVASVASPVLARFQAEPLYHAIDGLRAECQAGAHPAEVARWVDLIEDYVRRFAEPWRGDERIARLWNTVASQLDEPWPLERLAKLAHCSGEASRRLCHQHLNRGPGQHIIYLRMKRAAELLVSTTGKVEHIAHTVGYVNPFVFSATFKRWLGCTPSEYRLRRVSHLP